MLQTMCTAYLSMKSITYIYRNIVDYNCPCFMQGLTFFYSECVLLFNAVNRFWNMSIWDGKQCFHCYILFGTNKLVCILRIFVGIIKSIC